MPGFIHDELELKSLILYLAVRLIEPVPFETLLDLALCDDGVNYFDFNDCLRSLVETGNLARTPDGGYEATEKGRWNGKVCESDVPLTVRRKCDKALEIRNRALRRARQVRATWAVQRNGTWRLRLRLDDDAGSVMDLSLTVPKEETAKELAGRFQKAPERMFTKILAALMRDDEDTDEAGK